MSKRKVTTTRRRRSKKPTFGTAKTTGHQVAFGWVINAARVGSDECDIVVRVTLNDSEHFDSIQQAMVDGVYCIVSGACSEPEPVTKKTAKKKASRR